MTRYRSPHYPELRVALGDDKFVQFRDGAAEVDEDDEDALDTFAEKNPEYGVVTEEDYEPVLLPESNLGPGYTEAEKAVALSPFQDEEPVAEEAAPDEVAEPDAAQGEQDPDAEPAADLSDYSRDELRALAAEKGLPTGGTKDELAERIQAAE